MLTSVVLLLHAARPTHLPPYLGRANQAQFLRRLAEVEPVLAKCGLVVAADPPTWELAVGLFDD